MKTKLAVLLYFIMISIAVSGCSAKQAEQSESKQTESDPSSYIYQLSSGIAPARGGYYMLEGGLYYFDKEKRKVVPVCNKPECTHDDSSCNANVDEGLPPIYYCNNKLYVAFGKSTAEGINYVDLYEISADGSNRQKLYTIYIAKEEDQGIDFVMRILDGYVYYSFNDVPVSKDSNEVVAKLYRRKLEKNAKEECIYKYKEDSASFYLDCYNNNIYISKMFCEKGQVIEDLIRWDPKTEKITPVKKNIGQYIKIKNNIFYTKDGKIIKMDEKTKQEETIYHGKEVDRSFLKSDGTYLYLDNLRKYCEDLKTDYKGRHIEVIDTKGKKVDDLKTGNDDEFMGGDKDYLFFTGAVGNGMSMYDKKDLGTGKLNRIDLIKNTKEKKKLYGE